jgi:hypothetical protein
VKSVLVGRFGKSGTQLATFGFDPAKLVVRTTASKTAAVAKAKATREARGTKKKELDAEMRALKKRVRR